MAEAEKPVNVRALGFTLKVTSPNAPDETFTNLLMDPSHGRYVARIVGDPNSGSKLVDAIPADDPLNPTPPPNNRPRPLQATNFKDGADDDLAQISAKGYTNAIDALNKCDDVNILCVPDAAASLDIQRAMIEHCTKVQDRFAIIDSPPNLTPQQVEDHRGQLGSDNGYAALYYPWIEIANPFGGEPLMVPPSGHIAGVYARSDATRGVHKAPANEVLRGVRGVKKVLTDEDQGPLNELGINVLRSFSGRGVVVWGARTLAPSSSIWRYVNVRRLLLFIEESIQEGTRFAVFEPNDLALWQAVKRQVTDFLTRVWRDGALFGATPDQAFRVRVDEELNPPSQRALGILTIEVVVYPVTPAEFVVFRIIQQPGGPSVQEK